MMIPHRLSRPVLALAAAFAASGARAAGLDCVRYEAFLHRVGGLQFTGATDVVVSGDFAYVTIGSPFIYPPEPGRLRIVDVSSPAVPRMRGSVDVTGAPRGLAVSGGTALVITLESGLHVLDVSNPDAPVLVAWLDTPGVAVAVSGSLAYISSNGLQVIDIADPRVPRRIGGASVSPRHIAVAGGLAYVTTSFGLEIYDLADPAAPVRVGQLALTSAGSLAVEGARADVADGVWLRSVDVADPRAPRLSGSIRLADDTAVGKIDSQGRVVFASAEGRLQIVDASWPEQLCRLGSLAGSSAALAGALAYAVAGGLQLFDISNPSPAPALATLPTPPTCAVTISGTRLFGAGTDGLYVVDLAGPAPLLVGSTALPGAPCDVAVGGGIAFVAAGPSGLHAVDVSDPAAPMHVGTWEAPTNVHHVLAAAGRAFAIWGPVPDVGDVLTILDASRPDSLQPVVDWYELGTSAEYVLAGDLLYGIGSGLVIFDLTGYGLIGWMPTPGGSDIVLDGTHAYVAAAQSGLLVIEVADPRAPRLEASIPTPIHANRVAQTAGMAYVMDALGLQVIDVSDPRLPRSVGDSPALGIVVTDGARLYAAGGSELQVLPLQCAAAVDADLTPPGPLRLLRPFPNPFNPAVTIPFEIAEPQTLRLAVYTTAGRFVRELLRGARPAGRGSMRWDGRDAAGERVASGIYIVRLEAGSTVASRKVTLVE